MEIPAPHYMWLSSAVEREANQEGFKIDLKVEWSCGQLIFSSASFKDALIS